VARLGMRWGRVAWIGLVASCAFGTVGCSDEDEPDNGPDAAPDAPRDTARTDISVGTDVSSDGSAVDQRETGTPDARPDTARDAAAPDAAPEAGSCIGGGDAARDGAIGMAAVQMLRCGNCHQDEPVDAGLFLSGKLLVADSGVYPKNLTPDPMTGLGCWTDDQIIKAIMDGIDEKGETICSRMPKFAGRIDAGVAQEVVNFLRTLQAVHKEIPETVVCPVPPEARPEPQPEGGTDADAGAPPDGSVDGTAPDAGPDSTTPEAGADAGIPDVAVDVATDIETDGDG